MRVLCIDGVNEGLLGSYWVPALDSSGDYHASKEDEIFEGHRYTVVEEVDIDGGTFYQLAERNEETLYNAKRFIPLTDSAEVIAEHEHEAIIYQR